MSPAKSTGRPSDKTKLTREEKRAQRQAKKAARGPGVFAQMKQVYSMTKEQDPNITLLLVLVGLGTLLVFLLLGLLLNNWLTWLLIGIPVALLAVMFTLSRRAERAAFTRLDGQPGAAGAALSTLKRGWVVEEQPVEMDARTKDVVFRAVGRPGVVLVTEGPSTRVEKLVAKERRRIGPAIQNVPIHVIKTGNGEDQVPLRSVVKTMKKLDKKLTKVEVSAVYKRLSSLGRNRLPIPKGVDPMRARPDRKAMRGR